MSSIGRQDFYARHEVKEGLLKGKVLSDVTFKVADQATWCSGLYWDASDDQKFREYLDKSQPLRLDPKTPTRVLLPDIKSFLLTQVGAIHNKQAFDLQLVARPNATIVCALDAKYKYDARNPNQGRMDAVHKPKISRFYGIVDYVVIVTAFNTLNDLQAAWKRVSAGKDRQASAELGGYLPVLNQWTTMAHFAKYETQPVKWFSMEITRAISMAEIQELDRDLQKLIWSFVKKKHFNPDEEGPPLRRPTDYDDFPPNWPERKEAEAAFESDAKKFGKLVVKYKAGLRAEVRVV